MASAGIVAVGGSRPNREQFPDQGSGSGNQPTNRFEKRGSHPNHSRCVRLPRGHPTRSRVSPPVSNTPLIHRKRHRPNLWKWPGVRGAFKVGRREPHLSNCLPDFPEGRRAAGAGDCPTDSDPTLSAALPGLLSGARFRAVPGQGSTSPWNPVVRW